MFLGSGGRPCGIVLGMTTSELLLGALVSLTLVLGYLLAMSRFELRWQAVDQRLETMRERYLTDELELGRRVAALEELANGSLERRSARTKTLARTTHDSQPMLESGVSQSP